MSKQSIKATIDANIKQNGVQAITGQILNSVLNQMVENYAEQGNLESVKAELYSTRYGDVYNTELSTSPFVFKHLQPNGTLSDNSNKNLTFENAIIARKGSVIFVDQGYKYQYALYNISSGAFIERVTWKTSDEMSVLDGDYLIRIEVSDINESVLTDQSIVRHLHYFLFFSIESIPAAIGDLRSYVSSLIEKTFALTDYEKHNGILAAGKWNALSSSYQHIIIPVGGGVDFSIIGNSSATSGYCFLKSYSAPVYGATPDYATGYSEAVNIPTGTTIKVTSPQDAKYLYLLAKVDGFDRLPSSMSMNGKVNEIVQMEVDKIFGKHFALTDYEKYNGILAAGKWNAISNAYQHIIVSVDGGVNFSINANSGQSSGYCFLKSYSAPVAGASPDYATGYSEAVNIPAGTTVRITSPSDAKYLYLLANVDGSDRLPNSMDMIGAIYPIIDSTIEKRSDISNFEFSQQGDNIISVVGESSILEKKLTIVHPEEYSCWSFIGKLRDRLICVYTKALEHEDADKGAIFAKVSANGLIWTPKKCVIDTSGKRDGVTGKGNDNGGNLLVLNRVGYPSSAGTFYEVHRTSDGFNFEKIASNVFGAGHIGDIINVPNVGLVAFFNTYGNSRSWGKIVSSDNGISWTATTIESGLGATECPFEISAQYLGNGRILAIGRYDAYTGTQALWQMQSSDYGNTWTRVATNLVFGGGNTPSLLYNETTGMLDLFVYQRSQGKLFHIQNSVESVWNNASNWSNGVVIANGTTGQDAGNVNAVAHNGRQYITFYSGSSTETGIYEVIL